MKANSKKTKAKSAQQDKLSKQAARLKAKNTKLLLEKNFLERAMADLNFHNNAHDGVVYTDSDGRIVYTNPYFLTMMGIEDKKELIDKPFPTYMWTDQKESDRLFKDIKADGFVREREMALFNRHGEPVFAMCSGVASKDDKGNVIGTEIMFCNITSKRRFQTDLIEQNALLDAILQSTPDPIVVLSANLDIERTNPAAAIELKFSDKTKVNFVDLLARITADKKRLEKVSSKFAENNPFDMNLNLGAQHFDLHAAPLKSTQKGWVCVLHNITQSKETQEMLERHAFRDVLTQLPNRVYFSDHLRRANLRPETEPDYRFAVLFIDLDGLKSVNDRFGHHAGDELLIEFARRVEGSIRPGDLASRLGGDEFAVFLDAIGDENNATQVAGRVREALLEPYTLTDGQTVRTTASIGIALNSSLNADVDMLLRNADKAMYKVKERGGDSIEVFSPEMLAKVN